MSLANKSDRALVLLHMQANNAELPDPHLLQTIKIEQNLRFIAQLEREKQEEAAQP